MGLAAIKVLYPTITPTQAARVVVPHAEADQASPSPAANGSDPTVIPSPETS
jgi:hypothetical protein